MYHIVGSRVEKCSGNDCGAAKHYENSGDAMMELSRMVRDSEIEMPDKREYAPKIFPKHS